MRRIYCIAICFLIFILSCKSTQKTAVPVMDAAAFANLSTLQKGEIIFKINCSKCHRYHYPESVTTVVWNRILPKMIFKAKLDSVKAALLHDYIYAVRDSADRKN